MSSIARPYYVATTTSSLYPTHSRAGQGRDLLDVRSAFVDDPLKLLLHEVMLEREVFQLYKLNFGQPERLPMA